MGQRTSKFGWYALKFNLITLICLLLARDCVANDSAFLHPGLLQTGPQLEFMRQKVLAGEEPWKTAWNRLLAQSYSSLNFKPKPIAHVIRGAYGNPGIGDHDLMNSADAAYSQALQWVVTRDPAHARKAGQIIDAWSGTLQDFQANDAKLLAGWTGHRFCNAAEILRHTGAPWGEPGVSQFRRMLLTVYYPLIHDFYPQANGNWDASMIDTMLCMGVYLDDRSMFQRAVDHFLRGAGNAGIARYIYPTGQCEENARDQGHTQLGLGEMALACQVAWNQGVDLYGAVDNRLALGMEYTARYMSGENVPSICPLSPEGRGRFNDIYEGTWQHYHWDCGMAMPWVGRAVEQTRRSRRSWSALVLYRGSSKKIGSWAAAPQPSHIAEMAGALDGATAIPPLKSVTVAPGQSIQRAVNAADNGSWVILAKGSYVLPEPLRLRSGVTLAGQGKHTIVFLVSSSSGEAAIGNVAKDAHDIVLRDLVLDGGSATPVRQAHRDPNAFRHSRASPTARNRAGLAFASAGDAPLRNLRLEHLTVRNWPSDGARITGAANVVIAACLFDGNGGSVPNGPGSEHNLVLDHIFGAEVCDSRLDDSLCGSGLRIESSRDVTIAGDELARNARDGLEATGSANIQVRGSLAEANDENGFFILGDGSEVAGNCSRNNGLAGIRVDGVNSNAVRGNALSENGASEQLPITGSGHVDY